jgi:murein DD-endopeptidase MepM/ murein hydrolase activator NlpD
MDKRFTLLIYSKSGSFVRLKVFSQKNVLTLGVAGVLCALLFAFVLCDYAYLKYTRSQTQHLKMEVLDLKAEINERDEQVKAFYTKIDSLQMKLIKLNQLERQIRTYIGMNKATQKISDFGIGGVYPDDSDDKISSPEIYNNVLNNMDNEIERLDQEAGDQSEHFQALWATLREIIKIQEATPSIRPIEGGWISSKFGFRKSPFTGKREFHSGVDIADHEGTKVHASANGTIKHAGYKGLLGKSVFIDHGFGIMTLYGHLKQSCVVKGQSVKRGDIIGEVGCTGRSTGPHLHYEVRLNDIPVNAEKYMSEYLASNNPS